MMSSWTFIENINITPFIGLETFEDIKSQLEVDISRINITFNGELVKEVDKLICNNSLDVLRCCTQAVFFDPLDYLIKKFPDFHIVHNNNNSIKINVDAYKDRFWDTKKEVSVSTSFSGLRKNDLKRCFFINIEYIFEIGKNIGLLIFHIKKLNLKTNTNE